jgi:hypothetical protein
MIVTDLNGFAASDDKVVGKLWVRMWCQEIADTATHFYRRAFQISYRSSERSFAVADVVSNVANHSPGSLHHSSHRAGVHSLICAYDLKRTSNLEFCAWLLILEYKTCRQDVMCCSYDLPSFTSPVHLVISIPS